MAKHSVAKHRKLFQGYPDKTEQLLTHSLKISNVKKIITAANLVLIALLMAQCNKESQQSNDTPSIINTPVSGITLNVSTTYINLETGGTKKLIATITPANATNQAVTWGSSNTDVATVDANGKVTALKIGTVIITATTADGSKTAGCEIYANAMGDLSLGAGYLDLKWSLTSSGELSFSQGIAMPNFGPYSAPWYPYRAQIKKVRVSGIKNIGNYAFSRCTALTDVSFATVNGVYIEDIGNYAFSGCIALRGVPTPATVKTIGVEAFSGCTALQTIDMHNGLTTIGNWAFVNCIGLQVVAIPNSVKKIGEGAFNNCIKLRSATIGSGITSIGEDAFRFCPALKNVRCDALFPPALGARNFDAVGDELKVSYNAHDLYTLPSSVNGAAWRAAFDNNIVY
ncbi:leucine-rich repeat protein [Niabella hirudinis]|uniref:leucine-rich repeat protein n=1 Tax=Niabella hirudinis TaxID=1285929 RepID=UPI003EB9B04B